MEMNPPRSPLTCDIDGKTYRGTCRVAGKILIVSAAMGGRSKQLGSAPPGILAEQLLRQMAKDGTAKAPLRRHSSAKAGLFMQMPQYRLKLAMMSCNI